MRGNEEGRKEVKGEEGGNEERKIKVERKRYKRKQE